MEKKLSRESRNVVIVGTSLFILATVLTMKLEAGSDGWNTYGFPLTFYRYTNGKSLDPSLRFELGYLIIDYVLALSVSILLIEGIKKVRKQKPA